MPVPDEQELRRRLDAAGPEPFARLDAIYDILTEQDAAGRESCLDLLAGIDRELHSRASKMFDVDTRALAYFDSPPTLGATESADFARLPAILEDGTRLGSYEIVKLIARGGMGVVYEARQSSPRRSVALKLLRPELVTESLLRRFDLESEILGRLDHPSIAKIYESGVEVRDGVPVPFHAMELIEGVGLTRYVRESGASRERCLELFLQACDGVAHAHRKAVIHRDIKPSNILVDESGAVKLIDFGIARVVDEEGLEETLDGQVVGTVSHMSPEQARGSRGQVDTRTDVYSLGVVLHQLLVGRPPLDLADVPLPAAMRMICEDVPTSLGEVDSSCRGDLETIVAKALEKRREDRYPSVEALREDVRRHIDHETISARPVGAVGRLSKWVRREPVLAALLVVLLISLPTIAVLTLQYFESREAVERTRVADQKAMVEELLTSAYYEFGEGEATRAVEEFRSVLEIEPSSREAIGGLILSLIQIGRAAEAAPILEDYREEARRDIGRAHSGDETHERFEDAAEARKLEKTLPPATTPLEHYLMGQVALIEVHGGEMEACERAVNHMLHAALMADSPRELYFHHFAHAAAHSGDAAQARMAIDLLVKHWPDSPGAQFWAGFTAQSLGDLEAAAEHFEASAARSRIDSEIGKHQRFRALNAIAGAYNDLGKHEQTLQLTEEMDELVGAETLRSLTQRGNALRRLGRMPEALEAYRSGIKLGRTELMLSNLAGALSAVGELEEAEKLFDEAMRSGPSTSDLDLEYGTHCLNHGRLEESVETLSECVRKAPTNVLAWGNLCMVRSRLGDIEGAIVAGRRAVALKPTATNAHINLGWPTSASAMWRARRSTSRPPRRSNRTCIRRSTTWASSARTRGVSMKRSRRSAVVLIWDRQLASLLQPRRSPAPPRALHRGSRGVSARQAIRRFGGDAGEDRRADAAL